MQVVEQDGCGSFLTPRPRPKIAIEKDEGEQGNETRVLPDAPAGFSLSDRGDARARARGGDLN